MTTCPNCKKSLSCGCQKRKASDGKPVCTNCVKSYESKLTRQVWPRVEETPLPNATKFTEEQLEQAKNRFLNLFGK